MAITLRGVKGSSLTHPELDTNFTDLVSNDYNTYNTLKVTQDANDYSTYTTLTANIYNTFAYLNANSSGVGGGTLANDYNTYISAMSNDYSTYVALSGFINTVSGNVTAAYANDYNTYTTIDANVYDTYNNLYVMVTGYSYNSNGNGIPTITSNTNINLIAQGAVAITSPAVLRLPRMNTSIRNAASAQAGDMVFNTDSETFQGYTSDSDGLGNPGWVDLH